MMRPSACVLGSIAKVLRSKNAGPFEMTIDILFENRDDFDLVRSALVLTRQAIADIYRIQPEDVLVCDWFVRILAFKATIPRPRSQGGFGETDIHACQQYLPLASLVINAADPSPRCLQDG